MRNSYTFRLTCYHNTYITHLGWFTFIRSPTLLNTSHTKFAYGKWLVLHVSFSQKN